MGLSNFGRLFNVVWVLVRSDALLPREFDDHLPASGRLFARLLRLISGRSGRNGRPGQRLAACLESLGPVAIKLGQFLSTRADIFGAPFSDDLARLKDQLPPFSQGQARRDIEAALGEPIDLLFAQFDEAVNAASLAQVHHARLSDGREVAVKVLRPGIERRVAADIAAMALAARLLQRWVPVAGRLEPVAFAATISRALEFELDLRFEAAGADELRLAMAEQGYMSAPTVIWDRVARRVLTLTWAPGIGLSDPAALEQPGLDVKRLADNIVRAFLSQALDHGVFHADLHEGNLFVDATGHLTAVDFGIVGRLRPSERQYLAEILWGFLRRDYGRIADVHFTAGYVGAEQDRGAFAQALRAVGEPIFGRDASQVSMGRILTQLFEITALFAMRLRPELILLQKTMVTVEGVARLIDPTHDIWAAAEPVVRRWITRELSPVTRLRSVVRDAAQALGNLTKAQEPHVVVSAPKFAPSQSPASHTLLWFAFACGALAAGLAFGLASLFR